MAEQMCIRFYGELSLILILSHLLSVQTRFHVKFTLRSSLYSLKIDFASLIVKAKQQVCEFYIAEFCEVTTLHVYCLYIIIIIIIIQKT